MHRKFLASGLLLLFLFSIVSPLSVGWNVDDVVIEEYTPSDDDILRNIEYMLTSDKKPSREIMEYYKEQLQIISTTNNQLQTPTIQLPTPTLSPSGPADTDWPMKCHDNRHTSLSPYNTGHIDNTEKWRFKVSNSVDGGITIGEDGLIYFGSWNYHLYALYPDGNLKWKYKVNNIIWSAPAIAEDGTIYIGSYHTRLYAINPNGTRKWSVQLGVSSISTSPAIAEDGTIYVGTMEETNSKMYAIYPNGTIKWSYSVGYQITSDPAIGDDGTIYFGSMDDYVYALHSNGTLKWKYKTGDAVKGPPSIASDGTVYIGSWDGYLYAFYPNNGTVKWKTVIDEGFETNPSIGPDGTIYVARKHLWAVNPDGSIKWSFSFLEEDEDVFQSSPAISNDGIIYLGTNIGENFGGQIYSVNPDGTLRWKKMICSDWIDSSPAIAEDGTVYIGSTDDSGGYLHAFNEVTSNEPPLNPEFVGSTTKVVFSFEYYRFRGYDPDNNPIQFYIDWGTGRTSGWSKECAPGEILELYEMIFGVGRRTIRFKTRDVMGAESEWVTVELMYPYHHSPGWRFPFLTQIFELIFT